MGAVLLGVKLPFLRKLLTAFLEYRVANKTLEEVVAKTTRKGARPPVPRAE